MADDNKETTAPLPGSPGADPVLPEDLPVHDPPGTERGVMAEMQGRTSFFGYEKQRISAKGIRHANAMKSTGLNGAMPPWTLVDYGEDGAVHFRILHFELGSVASVQSREAEKVRRSLSWPMGEELPVHGSIEVNARTVCDIAIVECTLGSAVDLVGAAKANEIRNAGLIYAFPSNILPGLRLKMLHFGHPWLFVVRQDAQKFLREALGLKKDAPLPTEAQTEIERIMMIQSIVGCEGGTLGVERKKADIEADPFMTLVGDQPDPATGLWEADVDLKAVAGENVDDLRRLFVRELLPAANLRMGKVPVKLPDQIPFFREMFKEHNPDIVRAFREAHRVIRTAPNEKLLIWGEDFVAGADWERLDREARTYEPDKGTLVNLKDMEPKELSDTLRKYLWPKVPLQAHAPDSGPERERYFREKYLRFNNGGLEEVLNREAEIREADWELVLGKGGDYVAGLDESSGFTD